jgi:hypothetical protein
MEHTIHQLQDGVYHKFPTDRGTVWVKVFPHDLERREAALSIYEQESALASIDLPDDEAHRLPVMERCVNRFGVGLILPILRAVRASHPEVVRWVYERKGGNNPAERTKKGVAHAVPQ